MDNQSVTKQTSGSLLKHLLGFAGGCAAGCLCIVFVAFTLFSLNQNHKQLNTKTSPHPQAKQPAPSNTSTPLAFTREEFQELANRIGLMEDKAFALVQGTGISIAGGTITNTDLGSSQAIFKKIAVAGQADINAGSNTDTLTIAAGSGIDLGTSASDKKLTISAQSVDLGSNHVTGTLQVGSGGTGFASLASGSLVYGAGGTTALNSLGIGSANTVLTSSGTAPQWSSSLSLGGSLGVNGLLTASGGLTVPSGQNLTLSSLTSGSIPFINSSLQLAQDNSNLFWDATNARLGVGTNSPGAKLDVNGDITTEGNYLASTFVQGQPTNLVGNGSFETDTSGWAGALATITRVAGGYYGGYALRATYSGSGDNYVIYNLPTVSQTLANRSFTFSFYAKADSAGSFNVTPYLQETLAFSNAACTITDTALTTSWKKFKATCTWGSGITATTWRVILRTTGDVANKVYFDSISVQNGTSGTDYTSIATTDTGNTILYDGNVGIGTTAPTQKLSAVGTIQGGLQQTAYMSDAFTAASNWKHALFGTSYFDGANFITPNPGSNAVSEVVADLNGVSFFTAVSASNSARTDSPAAFNAYERMRIDTAGNVGIGTTNPSQARLVVAPSGGFNIFLDKNDNTEGGELILNGNTKTWHIDEYLGNLRIMKHAGNNGVYESTPFQIDSTGNVGIGTITPNAKLDVNGAAYLGSAYVSGDVSVASQSAIASQANNFNIAPNSSFEVNANKGTSVDNWTLGTFQGDGSATISRTTEDRSHGTYSIKTVTTGTTSLAVFTSTSIPVSPSTSYTQSVDVKGACASGLYSRIDWYDQWGNFISDSDAQANAATTASWATYTGSVTSPAAAYTATIRFYNFQCASTRYYDNVQLRQTGFDGSVNFATNTGSVGIGTTVPGAKLGIFKDTTTITDENDYAIKINDGTNDTGLVLGVLSGSDVGVIQTLDPGTLWSSRNLALQPNGGNVGIGTTNPGAKLDVNGVGQFSGSTLIGSGVAQGFYGDATNVAIRGYNQANSNLYIQSYNGASSPFFVGLSGTYAGNVGIGTTSPTSALHVAANITAASGFAYGVKVLPTLTAAANSDNMAGAAIGGIFATGTSTGLTATGLNVDGVNSMFKTGSGTITNAFAAWFAAPTIGTNNYAIYSNSGTNYFGGNVGIGTTAPLWKLHVSDTQSATAAAMIENTAANNTANHTGLILRLGSAGSATNPNSSDRFINFMQGNSVVVGSIQGNGSGGVTYATSGIDFAEYYRKEDSGELLLPGDVVCLGQTGGATKCTSSTATLLGVVSDRPGFVGGTDHQDDPNYVMVGLTGQLPVTVQGPINPSDPLTVSQLPGVAQKATRTGAILGYALAGYSGSGTGKVMASIHVSWADSTLALDADGNLTTSSSALNTTAPQLQNTGAIQSLNDQVTALATRIAILETQTAAATQAALLKDVLGASTDHQTPAVDPSKLPDTISGDFHVLGKTTLSDLGVTGNITAGVLSLHGLEGEINSVGQPLKLQSEGTDGIDILAGKVTIDTKGNITTEGDITAKSIDVEKVKVRTPDDVKAASIGTATIPAGQTSIDITTSALSDKSEIFATPDTLPVAVAKKKTKSNTFQLRIDHALQQDVEIDWWIVN